MKANWEIKKLEDCLDTIRGITFPKDTRKIEPSEGYVACLRTTNVQKTVEWEDLLYAPKKNVKRKEQFLRKGDILMSTANSYELLGKVALVRSLPHVATLGTFILCLRSKDGEDSLFHYYQLQSRNLLAQIHSNARTTTNISNVSVSQLKNFVMKSPPIQEQNELAQKLDSLFSKIDAGEEGLNLVEKQLEVYRQAVLKKMFNVQGRKVKLSAIGSWYGGGTPSKSKEEYWNKGIINWTTPKDMKNIFLGESSEKISQEGYESKTLKLAKENSILFVVRSGILRRTLPVAINKQKTVVNQDIKILEISEDNVLPEYILFYFVANNSDLRQKLSKAGTTVESINFESLKDLEITIPKKSMQNKIIKGIKKELTIIDNLNLVVHTTKGNIIYLKQAILEKAFNGELIC